MEKVAVFAVITIKLYGLSLKMWLKTGISYIYI